MELSDLYVLQTIVMPSWGSAGPGVIHSWGSAGPGGYTLLVWSDTSAQRAQGLKLVVDFKEEAAFDFVGFITIEVIVVFGMVWI